MDATTGTEVITSMKSAGAILRKPKLPDLRKPQAYIFTAEDGSAQGAGQSEAQAIENAFRLSALGALKFGLRIGQQRRGASAPVTSREGEVVGFVRPVWRN